MIITLQALSLVEMADAVRVCFPQCLRDQRSKWMQDGCKFTWIPHGIEWVMFHGHLDYFQKSLLGGRFNTKLEPWHYECSQPWIYSIYHVRGPTWLENHWNSIWLRFRSHMTSHYTWRSVTTLHDFGGGLGRPLDTFFWALTISWSRPLAHV